MIPTIAYLYNPSWSYGPTTIFALTTVISASLILLRDSSHRAMMEYSAFVTTVSGFIYNILVMISFTNNEGAMKLPLLIGANPAIFIFYSIYISFAFMPCLIAFHKISRTAGLRLGYACIYYFGYIWVAITIVIGLALTILFATKLPSMAKFQSADYNINLIVAASEELSNYLGLLLFIYFSNWALVATTVLLYVIHFRRLQRKARITLFVYLTINILSVIFFVVVLYGGVTDVYTIEEMVNLIFWLMLVLVDIPVAIGVLVAICFGSTWTVDSFSSGEKEEINSQEYNTHNNPESTASPSRTYNN